MARRWLILNVLSGNGVLNVVGVVILGVEVESLAGGHARDEGSQILTGRRCRIFIYGTADLLELNVEDVPLDRNAHVVCDAQSRGLGTACVDSRQGQSHGQSKFVHFII